jgi:Ca2+-binding RTX toxin-like protein
VSFIDDTTDNAHDITTGTGSVTVSGAGATDTITVTGNASSITANGSSVYSITGGAAGQTIIGSGQNDTITPGGGFDNVSAGAGTDSIISTYADFTDDATGADTIDGGAGNDTFTLQSVGGNVGPVSLVNVSNTERLIVNTGLGVAGVVNTTVTLDQITVARNVDANNAFTLTVNDAVDGDDDVITVSAAGVTSNLNVTVTQLVGAGTVSITTGSGADTITGSADNDVITTGGGNDTISAGGGIDNISAGDGNDTLMGQAGNDILNAGAGDDSLNGGADNDNLTGGLGIDTFNVDSGTDTITDLGDGADLLIVAAGATANATITTGTWAPVTGGAANAGTVNLTLADAATGVDLTNASVGVGFNGFTVLAGAGGDSITGSGNNDTITGGAGADTIYGGVGADVIVGGNGADVIYGDAGVDAIEGGDGADTLTGGLGIDTFTLTSTLTSDVLLDFTLGAGGDVLQVDQSDLDLAGADTFLGDANGVAADGSQEIVVLNTLSYNSDLAAAQAVAAQVTVNGFDAVIVYHNSTTGKVHVIHVTNSNTGAAPSLIAVLDNVTTLAGLQAAVAANFGGRG